ncbi:hypothetical protein FDO65_10090 [Nakamurella flava]|uniref:Uncharacterized protein n=1 Tax=Nakamurella flava TaxID=2576308 RepID=A0A4U6QMK1_9ACTN|nr:hypothetical protein [Nakamurella flava]TKV61864.1 hypothetical protein FDO65_10090 [Nakamurella flava]
MLITPDELGLGDGVDQAWAQADIGTVTARASIFAPSLHTLTGEFEKAAKGVLIDVVVRRYKTRNLLPGVSQSKAMGDRSTSSDTKDLPRALFWPEQITELQAICAAAATGGGPPVVAAVGAFPEPGRYPDPAERLPRWPV